MKPDLERWLSVVAVKDDEKLKKAGDDLDYYPRTNDASRFSKVPSTQKTKSIEVSSSLRSKTSSQRQTELLAKKKCEEIEEQNEAAR